MKCGVILFVVLLLALVWVAVAAQDIPPASVNPPIVASLPFAVQTAHPNGGITAVPISPLGGAPNTPPFASLTEPALPDAEVPLFIILSLEPESVGEVPLIVIPPLQDIAAVARWIIQALGDAL